MGEPSPDAPPPSSPAAAPAPAPKAAKSNLAVRLLTAAVMVPVLLALLYLAPPWGFLLLVFFASAVAGSELCAMTMPGERMLQAWGIAATLGLTVLFTYSSDSRAIVTALVVLVLVGMLLGLSRPDPIERAGTRIGWLIAGPLYLGMFISSIGRLHITGEHGPSWVVLCMMIAWFGDTGGYFAGRAFGKHKLYEKVSPKKTVEGSVGGLVGSVVGALVAHFWYLPSLPLVDGVVLALVGGALGQAGDLCESLVKRSTGVKDSGWIVPGHGGILDRIDALMFVGAAAWAYTAWLAA